MVNKNLTKKLNKVRYEKDEKNEYASPLSQKNKNECQDYSHTLDTGKKTKQRKKPIKPQGNMVLQSHCCIKIKLDKILFFDNDGKCKKEH